MGAVSAQGQGEARRASGARDGRDRSRVSDGGAPVCRAIAPFRARASVAYNASVPCRVDASGGRVARPAAAAPSRSQRQADDSKRFHPDAALPGRHRRGHRPLRPAQEGRRQLRGLLPVPQREDAVVHGEPDQAVLSLLRLRRARHRDRLPDGVRAASRFPTRSRSSRATPASRCRASSAPASASGARRPTDLTDIAARPPRSSTARS